MSAVILPMVIPGTYLKARGSASDVQKMSDITEGGENHGEAASKKLDNWNVYKCRIKMYAGLTEPFHAILPR